MSMVGRVSACLASPVPVERHATDASSKSGRILRPDFAPDRVIDGMDAAKAAAKLIAAAFPGRSENEVCERAAHALATSEQTIRRILRCETKDASWRVMSRCMVFLAAQGKNPIAVIGNDALTAIMGAALGHDKCC